MITELAYKQKISDDNNLDLMEITSGNDTDAFVQYDL